MIDHISLHVTELKRSRAFYLAALAPLDYEIILEFPFAVGFGVKPKPDFWLAEGHSGKTTHVAFRAATRKLVDAFFAAAMAAGGKDNGPPGPRHVYHPNYYGAFVLDPDGHNIEAVCHEAYLT
jgi:catechol 2,3-dioxygenase-like lactoylglutathione lyase family enzyme